MAPTRTALVVALLLAGVALAGQQAVRVFVVAGGEVVELDAGTFTAARRLRIPKELGPAPNTLVVNRAGQLLSCPPRAEGPPCWLFDGLAERIVARPARTPEARAVVDPTRSVPWSVLSADGQGLFWFENEYRVANVPDAGDSPGLTPSVSITFHAWRTDLRGEGRSPIVTLAFEPCRCATGACEETCSEASVWTPESGIDDFFVVTRWIPGQLSSAYQATLVYHRTPAGWTETRLTRPLETVLDAADGGRAIVHAVNDTGCCGWMNESADRTWLLRDGRNVPLFDERGEYGNDDYDVSFYTPNARLSPDGARQLAMTVASTLPRREEPRVAHDGKADPSELQRLRRAAAGLPAVVVADIAGKVPRRVARIRQATLVGWLDEGRLLLRRDDGTFEAWDAHASRGTKVPIQDGARVLVR